MISGKRIVELMSKKDRYQSILESKHEIRIVANLYNRYGSQYDQISIKNDEIPYFFEAIEVELDKINEELRSMGVE
jgi:hypothetical protein